MSKNILNAMNDLPFLVGWSETLNYCVIRPHNYWPDSPYIYNSKSATYWGCLTHSCGRLSYANDLPYSRLALYVTILLYSHI